MSGSEPDFTIELEALRQGTRHVCGIDEAGRGPWAGPVVAAAVVLDPDRIPDGLNDSKKLTEAKRDELFEPIMRHAKVGIGVAEVERIERYHREPVDDVAPAPLFAPRSLFRD